MLVLTEADLTVGARGPGLLRARKTQTLHIFRMQLLLRTSFLSIVKPDSMFVLYSLISLTTKAQNQNDNYRMPKTNITLATCEKYVVTYFTFCYSKYK